MHARVISKNEVTREEKHAAVVFAVGRTGGGGDSSLAATWSGASTLTTAKSAHNTLLQREAESGRNGNSPGILPAATPAVVGAGGGWEAILTSRINNNNNNNNESNISTKAVVSQAAATLPGVSPAGRADGGGGGADGDPVRSARIVGVSGGTVAGAGAASKAEAAAPSGGKAEELRSPRRVQGAVSAAATTEVRELSSWFIRVRDMSL